MVRRTDAVEAEYKRAHGVTGDFVQLAKYIVAQMVRRASEITNRRFPTVDNMILLESFQGKRLDCNPRAIYEYLSTFFPGQYEFVWVARRPEDYSSLAKNPHVRIVKYRSIEHFAASCTANVIISNTTRPNDHPSRKGQLVIQTWHGGGCYKQVGSAINSASFVTRHIEANQFRRFNTFISSSAYFTRVVIRGQFAHKGSVIEKGMPRNDCLVVQDKSIRNTVRNELGISDCDFLVLFAPTWRDFGESVVPFCTDDVKAAVARRFGMHPVLARRGHVHTKELAGRGFDFDLSSYPDMQGLLLACDAVITDYSSLIWDYSFTYRPCLLYTPDLKEYEKNRGFDVNIHEWGFPVCETSDALVEAIETFDAAQFRERMEHHHESLGSYESGHACEAVAEVIEKHCFGEKGHL